MGDQTCKEDHLKVIEVAGVDQICKEDQEVDKEVAGVDQICKEDQEVDKEAAGVDQICKEVLMARNKDQEVSGGTQTIKGTHITEHKLFCLVNNFLSKTSLKF